MSKNIDLEGVSNFGMKFNQWVKKRENDKTKNPTRDSTFVPNMGKIRDSDLDKIKADSQKTSETKLKENIDKANKR